MEREKFSNQVANPEPPPQGATDRQLADFFVEKLNTINDNNLKLYYFGEAEAVLKKMKDPEALEKLRDRMEKYRNKDLEIGSFQRE